MLSGSLPGGPIPDGPSPSSLSPSPAPTLRWPRGPGWVVAARPQIIVCGV